MIFHVDFYNLYIVVGVAMKTGLVLEGGAMRGMYTAGVLDVFMENNINFDKIAGVSAGAIFGVNFLSRQNGRVIRYNMRFNKEKDYIGLLPLIREGNIVNTDYAYRKVPRELDVFDDEEYIKNAAETPFYAVVTNIKTGCAEYKRIYSVFRQMDALRASGSMPFLAKPVEINGKKYLDGAVADSIPFAFLRREGCEKLVAVLTRDINFRKKSVSPLMTKLCYGKYKEFSKTLLNRHNSYNSQTAEIKRLEESGKAFVIRPSKPIEIGRIEKDPDKLKAVYMLGRKDAESLITDLKSFLESGKTEENYG